jgi:hypothetical protein
MDIRPHYFPIPQVPQAQIPQAQEDGQSNTTERDADTPVPLRKIEDIKRMHDLMFTKSFAGTEKKEQDVQEPQEEQEHNFNRIPSFTPPFDIKKHFDLLRKTKFGQEKVNDGYENRFGNRFSKYNYGNTDGNAGTYTGVNAGVNAGVNGSGFSGGYGYGSGFRGGVSGGFSSDYDDIYGDRFGAHQYVQPVKPQPVQVKMSMINDKCTPNLMEVIKEFYKTLGGLIEKAETIDLNVFKTFNDELITNAMKYNLSINSWYDSKFYYDKEQLYSSLQKQDLKFYDYEETDFIKVDVYD